MAQTLVLTDDIDGSDKDVSTIVYSFEGATYEIDLSKKNRDAFAKALTPYLNASRKAQRFPAARRTAAVKSTEDLNAIREWANKNKFKVSNRGRIAQEVKDAYYASK